MKGSAHLGTGIESQSARSPGSWEQQANNRHTQTQSHPQSALHSLLAVKTGNAVRCFPHTVHTGHIFLPDLVFWGSSETLRAWILNFYRFEFFQVLNYMCSPSELERASHHHIIHRIEGAAGVPLCSCSALKPVCRWSIKKKKISHLKYQSLCVAHQFLGSKS